jgi:tRNA C32,U32 (ribose-2'-O)-methylase TrmJ
VNAAKGAQWLVPRAAEASASLEDALRGTAGKVVGFHPWRLDDAEAEASRTRFDDLTALTAAYPAGEGDGGKLALVFGNEADGLSERELALCDALCSIPMGRLIESLSVTHAAVIALSRFYEAREASAATRRRF